MTFVEKSKGQSTWTGELPKNWKSDWLKWSVSLRTDRPTEDELERLPYISNEDITSWTGRLLIETPEPSDSDGRRFRTDDVLFNKLRPYLAKVFHADFEGICSGELLCLRPSQQVLPRFLFYVLASKGFVDSVNAETFGSKMPRADWEIVGHQTLPYPQLDTQRRIAEFLDEKTVRIDSLISKKQELLHRLTEKRQTLITTAVTKGLNPAAPMKDSGIDWLGRIPKHWDVMPVKRIAKLESGHTPDKKIDAYWDDGDIPWVSLNDTAELRADDYISDTKFKTNELGIANSSARLLPERAVVFTRDATIGESAITTRQMTVSQHIIAWLCDERRITPEYLLFLIYGMRGELLRLTNGATIGTIGLGDVKSIRVCVPETTEQRDIVRFVFDQKVKIKEAEDNVATSIKLLFEYRAALVTSAVTGKITELQ